MKADQPNYTLHLEMISGVAGDMLVASLLSLGETLGSSQTQADNPDNILNIRDWLIRELSKLVPDEKIDLDIKHVKPGGIKSLQINFHTPEDDWHKQDPHPEDPHPHKDHSHQHHSHPHHHHHAPHRNFSDIQTLIEAAPFTDLVKRLSLKTFEVLARAEARVHDTDYLKVHFHEVGSLDAILEVCGFFLLMEKWNVSEITASTPVVGSGTVNCAHGRMPVPVPAVLNMIHTHDIPYKKLSWETGELTTPTGLAILIGSGCQFSKTDSPVTVQSAPVAIGYGAGHKSIPGLVNLLRSTLNIPEENTSAISETLSETLSEIKVNLDDMTGEEIAALVDQIFLAGALDVCQYPVYMKKSRPGVVLEILCRENKREAIGNILLHHSSSPGYRYNSLRREALPRREIKLEYQGMTFFAKEVTLPNSSQGTTRRIKIEDNDLRNAQGKLPLSRRELIQKLTDIYRKNLKNAPGES